MKRTFYLTIEAMRPFCILQEKPLIELIFPQSDVKEHLMDKLFTYRNRYENPASVLPIFNFYESLDAEHQLWFDQWFNSVVENVDAKTVQHLVEYRVISVSELEKRWESPDVLSIYEDAEQNITIKPGELIQPDERTLKVIIRAMDSAYSVGEIYFEQSILAKDVKKRLNTALNLLGYTKIK